MNFFHSKVYKYHPLLQFPSQFLNSTSNNFATANDNLSQFDQRSGTISSFSIRLGFLVLGFFLSFRIADFVPFFVCSFYCLQLRFYSFSSYLWCASRSCVTWTFFAVVSGSFRGGRAELGEEGAEN